ncbi:MAG: phosphate acetyltransferase, partial [Thermodesulfatator sp.]
MAQNKRTGSIYVTALEPKSGKLMVTLGLMEVVTRLVSRVGFFRPVIRSGEKPDNDLSLILNRYNLDISYEDAHVFTVEEVHALGAEGKFKEIVQAIIERYNNIRDRFEFVLCEGFESSGISTGFDVDANINIAKNLGSPILGVLSGKDKQQREITESLKIVLDSIESEGCFNVATIVNRVSEGLIKSVWESINQEIKGDVPVYVIPEVPELASPTMGEIMEGLGCSFVHGERSGLNRVIRQFKIAAMTLDNYLSYLEDGDLIITPGDREDIVVGTLTTLFSQTFPNISGILLTGGLEPGPRVARLISGLRKASIPIISARDDTFTSAMKASQVPALISKDNPKKVDIALGTFESTVNIEEIRQRLAVSRSEIVTPLMFQYSLFERARQEVRHIVLPEGDEDRILQASEILRARNVV